MSAPLPGKLPEWPEWQEDDLDYAGYYHELAICWESRREIEESAKIMSLAMAMSKNPDWL